MKPLTSCCANVWRRPAVLEMLMYRYMHSAFCAPAATASRPLATLFRGFP